MKLQLAKKKQTQTKESFRELKSTCHFLHTERNTFYTELISLYIVMMESKEKITSCKKIIEELEKISFDAQSVLASV